MIRRMLIVAAAAAPVAFAAFASAENLVDLSKEQFPKATQVAGGQKFELDLGTKRANWTTNQWSVLPFAKTKDLSQFQGIQLVVATDKPRADAGVYIALREESGTWYIHPWAANLTNPTNSGVANFEDFSLPEWCAPPDGNFVDANGKFDLDKINAIAIGTINPMGIGKLEFTVKEIKLVSAAAPAQPTVAKVEVTGKLIDINGTTAIPAGLFGGFNLMTNAHKTYRLAMDRQGWGSFGKPSADPVTHMMINCYGDRAAPSIMMNNPQWKEKLTADATKAAEASKSMKGTHYVEWWNEPYLNWSNKNRKMFNPDFYNLDEAKEGGAVKLKSDGSDCPHLKWTQNYEAPLFQWVTPRCGDAGQDRWRRGKDAAGKLSAGLFEPLPWSRDIGAWRASMASCPPKDVKDGEKYTVTTKDRTGNEKKTEYTAMTPWWVYDETQFTYWSAKGMGRFYNEPMLAAGKALKAANPNIVYIAGWGYRPSEDHWEAFKMNYQPTIDIGHEVIDGIHDHDYGGDAVKMAANYEVTTAYGMTKYNKWLTSWNTETASSTDPQAYAGAADADKMNAANPAKFTWTARKLIHTLAVCPDKARAFAWFGSRDNPNPGGFLSAGGEGVLFTMLKNLRGKLVQIKCDNPDIFAVASIDGTDPQNPRPEDMPQRKEMVVVVLNESKAPRDIELAIAPPTGTKFGQMFLRTPKFDSSGTITVEEKPLQPGNIKAQIPARGIIAATLVVEGDEPAKPEVTRKQFFGQEVVVDVTPAKPVTQKIAIKPDDLKTAKRAWLRIVTERLADHGGVATINGKDYPLPKAVTPENAAWVRQIPVNLADLKESNELIFKVQDPAQPGYFLGMASLVIESE